MKELIAGLWSALCIGATLLWEGGVQWWHNASLNKRTVLVVIVAMFLLFGMARCVNAEPATADTNYQLLQTDGSPEVAFCPLQEGVAETGVLALCLVGMQMRESMYIMNGTATYCVVTGMKKDRPYWECGSYEHTKNVAAALGI